MKHLLVLLGLMSVAGGGCASRTPAKPVRGGPDQFYYAVGLSRPVNVASVEAQCAPPVGWKAEPLKESDKHTHQVWLSPTGKTAYGVIHFKLPFPVGVSLVHWEFLREMQRHEGEAVVESAKQNDPSLPGMRFICEAGRYKMRVNLIVHGFDGWAIYAGTHKGEEPVPAELELAERARENTITGLSDEAVRVGAE